VTRLPAAALALALLAGSASACASDAGGHGDQELTVLAAASLTDVFEELAEDFEAEHDATVTLSFGSSTELAAQAADGAPGDVLATADEVSMELAASATTHRAPLATNRLVMVTRPGNPDGITTLDDLDGVAWVRCADEVPCGRVATAVLAGARITTAPVSLEEDVRATLDKVVSGEVDAGLVYATDAVAAGGDVTVVELPEAADHLTTYVVATLAQAEHPDLAEAWLDQLLSPRGRDALTRAGFGTP
jgi:molybdate transport system substrate-binding protein